MYQELAGSEADLVAYYNSNATAGKTLTDNSINSNTGTLNGMTGSEWLPSAAFFGPKNCLDFDGDDNVGAFYIPYSNGDITIEAWIKTTSTASEHDIFSWGRNDGNLSNIQFRTSGGKFQLGMDPDPGSWQAISSTQSVNTGIWVHLAAVKSGNSVTLYVNGVEDGSGTITNTMIVNGSDIAKYYGTSNFFTGSIDELRIWHDIRTVTEIRENMYKSLSGNETDLVAYFNFDASSTSSLPDYSPTIYDGQLSGNPTFSSSSAFNSWLSTDDTDWSIASNWSNGIPAETDNVGIYNLSGSDPRIPSAGTGDCNHLFIESEAGLTVASGGSLITNGTINNNGTFTAEKSIDGDSKWHLISAPNNNTTSSNFDGFYLQSWDEPTANWNEITELEVLLTPVKGYSIFDIPAKTDFSFSGTPNTGDQNITITYNDNIDDADGTNLLGNPYPSAIDWGVLDNDYGAVYIGDPSALSGAGDYLEWNNGSGSGEQYIPPMQGFFIVTNTTKTFNIGNNSRTHTGANNFYKSEKTIENGIVLQAVQDELWIKFDEESSNDFELVRDAFKLLSLGNGQSQLYSKYADTKLAIDVRPETEIIQLGFQNNQNGHYQIGVKDIDGITQAEIEDTKLNTFHDLSQGTYHFDWQTSDSEERFILHLKATATQELVEQEAQVYSNNGQIYIRQTSSMEFQSVQIFDLAGRVIYSSSIGQEELQSISLSKAKGVYLVQLSGENKNQTNKVIFK